MRKSEVRRVIRKAKILILGYTIVTLITLALVRLIPEDRRFIEFPPELKNRIHKQVESLGHTDKSSPRR